LGKPELTIGVSFYNTADTLIGLAKCIFAQTFKNWEWILIDDGSTDGGYDIVRAIKDPRVRVIRDDVNRGRSSRYNYITRIARGDFIARFDADDLCHPTRLQKQVEFLRKYPNVDLVSTDLLCLGPSDVPLGRHNIKAITHEEICCKPLQGFRISHAPMMGRTEWFREHPYPEQYRIAVDYALFLSSYSTSCFANIPEPLYFYREYATHSLQKYYRTNVAVSQIIKEYAPAIFSSEEKLKARLARYLRIGAYALTTAVGLQRRLIAQRNPQVLSEENHYRFEEAMKTIKSTKVPGIAP
jgi:glycosyltransferase involved in cell wall biosynthesis